MFPCGSYIVKKSGSSALIPSVCLIGAPSAPIHFLGSRDGRISRSSTRSFINQTTLFSCTSSPSSRPFSGQNSYRFVGAYLPTGRHRASFTCHSFCFRLYVIFVFLGQLSRACASALAPCSKSSTSRATRSCAVFAVTGARAAGEIETAEAASTEGGGGGEERRREDEAPRRSPGGSWGG
jgi:hypothetical protein